MLSRTVARLLLMADLPLTSNGGPSSGLKQSTVFVSWPAFSG